MKHLPDVRSSAKDCGESDEKSTIHALRELLDQYKQHTQTHCKADHEKSSNKEKTPMTIERTVSFNWVDSEGHKRYRDIAGFEKAGELDLEKWVRF